MSVRSRVFVGVALAMAMIAASFVFASRASATNPTITSFTADYCETTPLPAACNPPGGPGASQNIVLTWNTNAVNGYTPVYIWNDVGFESQSGTAVVPLKGPGRHTYTLEAFYNDGQTVGTAFKKISIDIPGFSPPNVTSASSMSADFFTGNDIQSPSPGSPPTISWSPGGGPWTAISANGFSQVSQGSGQHAISQSELHQALGTGTSATYNLSSCVDQAQSFCGGSTSVSVSVTGAHLQGSYRQFVPVGGSATVNWNRPSWSNWDYFLVSAPTLSGGSQAVWNQTSMAIPIPAAGVVPVRLLTCVINVFNGQSNCGPQNAVTLSTQPWPAPLTLTSWLTPQGTPASGYSQIAGEWAPGGTPVARITDANNATHDIRANVDGFVDPFNTVPAIGSTVTPSTVLTNIDSASRLELDVGTSPGVINGTFFTNTPWTSAFSHTNSTAYSASIDSSLGNPTDVAINQHDGHVFWDSEFSSALGEADPTVNSTTSSVTVHPIPLKSIWDPNAQTAVPNKKGLSVATKPFNFGYPYYGNLSSSPLGEGAIYANGKIWDIQGGGFVAPYENQSRIISYTPSGVGDFNVPANLDNHVCAYSVPTNNNEVYGLSSDGTRIWFAEFVGNSSNTGAISWFDPSQLTCDSMLDYSNVDANYNVAGAHQYCSSTVTSNCVHTVSVCNPGDSACDRSITHIVADPCTTVGCHTVTVWYSTVEGHLGKLTYDSQSGAISAAQQIPVPPQTSGGTAFPWSLRVDQTNVYFVENNDFDLVKYNKSTQTFSEIRLPLPSTNAYLLSLELYNGRVYFLTQDGIGTGSSVGYVNIAGWNAGNPTGTIYTGVSSLLSPNGQVGPTAFNGLSINQTTGDIAIGNYTPQRVLLLRNNPVTNVLVPSDGATVSGSQVTLDASNVTDFTPTKVEFYLTGGTLNHTLIGTATPTLVGWIYQWDSTAVPNGSYTLQSTAYDSTGNVNSSNGIGVTVAN